jgi:2-C-methyl-D-erythritol 2,4-cyclodiphosphate synthase
MLGALGEGDIGVHFPDTDDTWKDASSIYMLEQITELVKKRGFAVQHIDSTVIAERPKMRQYIDAMKECIAKAGIPITAINIKAKTNEGLGLIGNEEGMAAQAVCLLRPS